MEHSWTGVQVKRRRRPDRSGRTHPDPEGQRPFLSRCCGFAPRAGERWRLHILGVGWRGVERGPETDSILEPVRRRAWPSGWCCWRTYLLTGKGLGASGASFRLGVAALQAVAPAHVEGVPLLAGTTEDGSPLRYWLVFEVVGVVLGGFLAALTSGRLRGETLKGPTFPGRGPLGDGPRRAGR